MQAMFVRGFNARKSHHPGRQVVLLKWVRKGNTRFRTGFAITLGKFLEIQTFVGTF